MKIIALIAARNEELFIEKCISHLYAQGVNTILIDNGSTDRTVEIAQKMRQKGLEDIHHMDFNGKFDLYNILKYKENICRNISADWFMHYDSDELRYAPSRFASLRDGIAEADRQGYNAVNFDEFVFLPTSVDDCFENSDYEATMQYYYYYAPKPYRHVKAWKNTGQNVDLASLGGHRVRFENIRIFPENFILKHYIFLSYDHACRKYGLRRHSDEGLKRGWHTERNNFRAAKLVLPDRTRLKFPNSLNQLDTSDPWKNHTFFGHTRFSRLKNKIFQKLAHAFLSF